MKRRTALITGASKGIGRAVAICLAQNGYDIGINYNSHREAAEQTAQIVRSHGAEALILHADVGSCVQITEMFSQFTETFGTIDLMVNNAGVSMFAPLLQVTEQMWDQVNDIDWKGTYFCTQRAAQLMIDTQKQGVILNMSSNQKDGCWPTASVYGPAKAAITKFTRHAAMELAPMASGSSPSHRGTPMWDGLQTTPSMKRKGRYHSDDSRLRGDRTGDLPPDIG